MAEGANRLRGLNPVVRNAAQVALAWADFFSVPVRVTSGFRSLEEQAELRRRFLQGRSRFPANAPGDSAHNFGLAWDSQVPPEFMPWWIALREWIGFCVPSNDAIHAEVCGWRRFV